MSQRARQEPAVLILIALAGGAQHGYGEADREEIVDGRLRASAAVAAWRLNLTRGPIGGTA